MCKISPKNDPKRNEMPELISNTLWPIRYQKQPISQKKIETHSFPLGHLVPPPIFGVISLVLLPVLRQICVSLVQIEALDVPLMQHKDVSVPIEQLPEFSKMLTFGKFEKGNGKRGGYSACAFYILICLYLSMLSMFT